MLGFKVRFPNPSKVLSLVVVVQIHSLIPLVDVVIGVVPQLSIGSVLGASHS